MKVDLPSGSYSLYFNSCNRQLLSAIPDSVIIINRYGQDMSQKNRIHLSTFTQQVSNIYTSTAREYLSCSSISPECVSEP